MELNSGGITPYLGRNDPRHQYVLEGSFVEKAMGVLLGTRLTISHHRAPVAKPADGHLGMSGRAWAAGRGRRPCCSARPC